MKRNYFILTVNSVAHGLVDAACAFLVIWMTTQSTSPIDPLSLVLLYNFLAFATQPIFGFAFDKFNKHVCIAAIGCLITAVGLSLYFIPVLSVVLVGVGNAVFHIGGGITSLKIDSGRAWAPGIFIAPGNIGLLFGTLLGKQDFFGWGFVFLLIFTALIIIVAGSPQDNNSIQAKSVINKSQAGLIASSQRVRIILIETILLLVLATVFIRSLAGMAVSYSWKTDLTLLMGLSLSVTLGKGLGGVLADKFGWSRVSVLALILSIPLLVIGFTQPFAGMAGMFLFNFTMPVTLVVATNLYPKHEGFAFGLTVLFLSLGTIPVFGGFKITGGFLVTILVLISALILFASLNLYNRVIKKSPLEVQL